MKLSIDEHVAKDFTDIKIGVIVASDIDNTGKSGEIDSILFDIQERIKDGFSAESIKGHPTIARWRQIYSRFGSKPSDYNCSAEALIRSVLKGRTIASINKLVNLYSFISLKYVIPAGGEDLDKVEGSIRLKAAGGTESFVQLNTSDEEKPYRGEIIYCDDSENVLCRRWNWRESDKTKLTEKTKNAVIVLEGFDEDVGKAVKELAALIEQFCGGEIKTFILDKNTTEIEW